MLVQRLIRILPMLLAVTVASAQVTVSVRDTSARPVDTLLVPLSISGLAAGDSVYSLQATLNPGTPAVRIICRSTARVFRGSTSSRTRSSMGFGRITRSRTRTTI